MNTSDLQLPAFLKTSSQTTTLPDSSSASDAFILQRKQELTAHMALVTRSEEPRAYLALVRRSETKIRLGTRVIEFAKTEQIRSGYVNYVSRTCAYFSHQVSS